MILFIELFANSKRFVFLDLLQGVWFIDFFQIVLKKELLTHPDECFDKPER